MPTQRLTAVLAAAAALVAAGWTGCRRAATPGGTVSLSLWTLALAGPFDGYMKERVAAFEALHPGVSVRWVDVPFGAMDRKLIAAAGSGLAPDVVNLSDMTAARFAALGALADLGPHLSPATLQAYLPEPMRLGRMGGRIVGLPWYLTTQAVLANTQLLARGGLSAAALPRDWAALRALAVDFKARTGAYLFTIPLGQESDLPMMLLSEGLLAFETGPGGIGLRGALDKPQVVEYIRAWVDLYRAGALPREAATAGVAHLAENYQNGRVALINSGPNFLKRIRDAAPSVFAATESGPPVTGALGRGHIAVMMVGATTQSRHPALAAQLAAFITSPESQEKFCALAVILPSTAASLDHPMFSGPDTAQLASTDAALAGDARVQQARATTAAVLRDAVAFTPAMAIWPDLRRVFEEGIKRALLDGADVRATLAAIDREWDAMLAAAGSTPDTGGPSIDAIPRAEPRDAGPAAATAGGGLSP